MLIFQALSVIDIVNCCAAVRFKPVNVVVPVVFVRARIPPVADTGGAVSTTDQTHPHATENVVSVKLNDTVAEVGLVI